MESFGLKLRTAHERDLRVFDFYGSPRIDVPSATADAVTPLPLERASLARGSAEGRPLLTQSRGSPAFFPLPVSWA